MKRTMQAYSEYYECSITYTVHINMSVAKSNNGGHFSITGSGRDVWGCLHSEFAKAYPEYAKYLKWHLFNVNTGPMHYIANACYHFGISDYDYSYNEDQFKSTIVFGSVKSDYAKYKEVKKAIAELGRRRRNGKYAKDTHDNVKAIVEEWLNERTIAMFDAFRKDMQELFLI